MLWTALVLLVMILPFIFLCANKIFTYSFASWRSSLKELTTLTLRFLITISLLPFEAFLAMDALLRVAYRRLISHRNLLQWSAYEYMNNGLAQNHHHFLHQLGLVSFFAVVIFASVIWLDPFAELIAFPFCLLWLAAPFIVHLIDKPLNLPIAEQLLAADKAVLRQIARLTWRYFDELIGPHTNWLPPDNYQTALNIEIAQRTSPTNIGMGLLATIGAYDFNYITCDQCLDRLTAALQQVKKLEMHEGHFLNWYHLQTLEPLSPRYVSTVDSGNFLACLWTLRHGIEELLAAPLIPAEAWSGIRDTQHLLHAALKTETPHWLSEEGSFIGAVKAGVKALADKMEKYEQIYWGRQLSEQLAAWELLISRYFGWVELLAAPSPEQLRLISPEAPNWLQQAASSGIPLCKCLQNNQLCQHWTSCAKQLSEATCLKRYKHGERSCRMLFQQLSGWLERRWDQPCS